MDPKRDDLTIDDVMADPLIGAVMKADGVEPRAFRTLLDLAASARLQRGRRLDHPAFGCARSRVAVRPWTGVKPPPAASADCRTPLPW